MEGKKSLKNLAKGSTPLHAAALGSSLEIFEYLLLHGGDPLIENIYNEDAFDISYKCGNYEFMKYIFNLKCSRLYSFNDKYLLSLIKNGCKGFFNIFEKYININTFENYNMVDENMNTLLILACIGNNIEIINLLINVGVDPLIKNKDGNTCLHICVYNKNYECAGIILSKIESLKDKNKIIQILSSKNNSGETPLHISSDYNQENFVLLFISYFIRNDIKFEMIKNNAGLNPLQLSIKKHNYNIALIYINFLNFNISDILEIKNLAIEKEFDDFIYCYDSGFLREYEKFIEEKFKGIDYFISQNLTIPDKFKENNKEEYEVLKNMTYNDFYKNIKLKSFESLFVSLNKYYKTELFDEEIFYNHQSILGNIYIMETLVKWAKNKNFKLINLFLNLLKSFEKECGGYLMDNINNANDEFYKLFKITSIISFPYISEENSKKILEFFKNIIDLYYSKNLNNYNEFVKFLKLCMISYFDSPFIKPNLSKFINELIILSRQIFNDEELIKAFKFSSSIFQTYENLYKINFILGLIYDKYLQKLQLLYLSQVPCLLENEIIKILHKYHILHESILIEDPIYDFNKLILNKKNYNIFIIKEVLFITEEIKKCHELQEKEKSVIIQNIIDIYNKYEKNFKDEPENISSFLVNFFLLSKQIIINTDLQNYIITYKDIMNQIEDFNQIIPYVYIYSTPKEIVFPNFEEKLQTILDNIQLTNEEKNSLSKIALLIPKYCENYKYIKDFKQIGIKFGKEFKLNPNYENLSKLISIISVGVASFLNIRPYLIQCLTVSSFLLYYIDIQSNNNYEFKGKLAQIKTGEGKSLIIAMLALANALMGNFVDIITSTII